MSDAMKNAFRELTQVCRTRPGQAEGDIAAMASRLFKVLGEYGEPVALTALDMWPRKSEWFPTEKELRDLCEDIASQAAIDAASRGKCEEGVYRGPVGNTVMFVDAVRDTMGEAYVRSWLSGGINCLFGNDTIYTTPTGMQRLVRDCFSLMGQCGVQVKTSLRVTAMLAEYCDGRELEFEPKRVRR